MENQNPLTDENKKENPKWIGILFLGLVVVLTLIVAPLLLQKNESYPSLENQIGDNYVAVVEDKTEEIKKESLHEHINFIAQNKEGLDDETKSYLSELSIYFKEYEHFYKSIGELNETLYANFNLSTSNEWNQELNTLTSTMNAENQKIHSLTPPQHMKEFHQNIIQGVEYLNNFLIEYPEAIQSLNEESFDKCVKQFQTSYFIFDTNVYQLK